MLPPSSIPGRLEMSPEPLTGIVEMSLWSDILTNRILTGISIILVVGHILMYLRTLPSVLQCLGRNRLNIELEHSYNMSKQRNLCALYLALPFCLVVGRYRLYRPVFMADIPETWQTPAIAGVLFAFLLLRHIIHLAARPKRVPNEVVQSAHHVLFTFFIPLAFIMLATVGILSVVSCSDSVIKSALLWEAAGAYLLAMIREMQILVSYCSGFSTILYLCTSELVPALVLVASAVKL